MLKFKNKFKFGSTGDKATNGGASPTSPTTGTSEQHEHDSPRTSMSTSHISDTMLKLSIKDRQSQDTTREESTEDYNQAIPSKSSSVSLSTQTPEQHDEDDNSSQFNPGLLTVKIYNSARIELPIHINNNKQILHALAINANNESVSLQLLRNLGALEDTDDHMLAGTIALSFLPLIITIPSAENLVKSLLYLTIEFENNVLVIEPQKGTVSQSTWNQVVLFDVTKKGSAPLQPHSVHAEGTGLNFLNLNLFMRLPNMLIPEEEKVDHKHLFTNNSVQNNANNIGDLLIGSIKLPLNLRCHTSAVRLMNHEYLQFTNNNVDLAKQITKQMGEIMLTIEFKPVTKKSLSVDDFDLLKVIGRGSFGKVMHVVKKDTKQIYALKTLRKQQIVSRHEVTHTLAERTVLARINNPFIVPLKFSFQSPEKLYLVLAFINGGELFWHLQREGKFSMDRSRFYIAELLTALELVHELNVIYRDLKPENILLDYQGHIALCDFGLCKLNMDKKDKTNTFCGTPEYLAPELLLNQGYTRSVDWWTLGTLLYEMLTGLPPFYHDDPPTMYRKILQNPLKFPAFLEGTDAEDLLVKLLKKDPAERLSEASEIKAHPFFKDIDWCKLLNKAYIPPFKPNVDNLLDTSNFDQDFTNEQPQDSVVDDFLSESVQQQFTGWTYNGDTVLR